MQEMPEIWILFLGLEDPLEQERLEQHTPVFLPGKSHGHRSLLGYSPWGHKELDVTEHAHMHALAYLSDLLSNSNFYFPIDSYFLFRGDLSIFPLG